ncbi:MAG: Calvin cycle protein CP12 [Scytonema sp. PMC 1069.18]|nr:Calvin cycle protein CP12 [Scytonema sp. PMC 1069.18]MEC4882656.1 Calvin cycle protein CP12 [Scytonema sp. PMC 1070.18]
MTTIVNANWENKTIEQAILEAVQQARAACDKNGNDSSECAVAWDIVEELQAEKSHRQVTEKYNSLQKYCAENPEAVECLMYDV